MRILLSISVLLLWLGPSFAHSSESISSGLRLVSPNGRYSVELGQIDGESHFIIKDAKTGREDNSIAMPTVLLYLHWAENSQSIVTVEHIAHGSYGRIIYLKDDKWMNVQVEPPSDGMRDSAVVRLEVKRGQAHYGFAVRHVKSNGMPLDYQVCNLDVNLQTGEISNLKRTSISQAEFIASLARKPVYEPSMKTR